MARRTARGLHYHMVSRRRECCFVLLYFLRDPFDIIHAFTFLSAHPTFPV